MSFRTGMTVEEFMAAGDQQRKRDIVEARMWRDHYQGVLNRLEGRAPKPQAGTLRKLVEFSEVKAK